MSEDFDKAFATLMKLEGGYVNDAADDGGETNFGISKAQYPNVDVAHLTQDQAKAIYRKDFWDKFRCGDMPFPIGGLLFDCVVNHNPTNPVKWMQSNIGVLADGIIGPRTVAAAQASRDPVGVATEMTVKRVEYVKTLPDYPRFGKGWHARHVRALSAAISNWR
ncbi:glycoside hydrolase family 108 protein [Limnoglobus roseus]|uniref:Uncharacterized protein n=1 Tax=Limnoglobus roseus TaxID=2598579 RepID=A0A5C1AR34_9BACT|nr:glycosyl hydrolase 108 family protein [Limnoglobus roseus]QEL19348.1 hypothetical protein PX52LOC_06417 [Limnoglobus roseus]